MIWAKGVWVTLTVCRRRPVAASAYRDSECEARWERAERLDGTVTATLEAGTSSHVSVASCWGACLFNRGPSHDHREKLQGTWAREVVRERQSENARKVCRQGFGEFRLSHDGDQCLISHAREHQDEVKCWEGCPRPWRGIWGCKRLAGGTIPTVCLTRTAVTESLSLPL
jgi:hypothetical protein